MQRKRRASAGPLQPIAIVGLLFALLVPITGTTGATSPANDRRCEKIEQRIDWIRSRMRSGYTASQGERWKSELRRLKAERRSRCR